MTKFPPRKSGNPKGRPRGVRNKLTASVKGAIMHAFEEVGGVDYLVKVAEDDPKTFCGLLAKVLPLTASDSEAGTIVLMWRDAADDEDEADGRDAEAEVPKRH